MIQKLEKVNGNHFFLFHHNLLNKNNIILSEIRDFKLHFLRKYQKRLLSDKKGRRVDIVNKLA